MFSWIMGATQACSSIERPAQKCTIIQSVRPDSTIRRESQASSAHLKSKKDNVASSPVSLWSKCQNAVHEFRKFQKFLKKQYSGPSQAFDSLFEDCKHSPRGCVSREDFICLVEKAGFKGETRLVFAMLKGGAEEFITRDSFKKRQKARPSNEVDDLADVVGQAVAAAALERGMSGLSRGRSQHREKSKDKSSLTRGQSNVSLRTESTTASSRRASTERHSSKERKQKARSNSKQRSTSPSPPGRRRRSAGRGGSKSPEPSKRSKSLARQKSR